MLPNPLYASGNNQPSNIGRAAAQGGGSGKERDTHSEDLALVRWQGRKIAVPLLQLAPIDVDESTEEAIGDWHYWIAKGYIL